MIPSATRHGSLTPRQYFTWADRMGNSYRQPARELDPLLEVKALEAQKQKAALGKEQ